MNPFEKFGFVRKVLRVRMRGMNERLVVLLTKLNLCQRAVYADDVHALKAVVRTPADLGSADEVLTRRHKESEEFFRVAPCDERMFAWKGYRSFRGMCWFFNEIEKCEAEALK